MFIVYFDESGDDGWPGSSRLFTLTSLYLHHQNWKESFDKFYDFRKYLHKKYGIPTTMEFHTKAFLLNKHPYGAFRFNNAKRLEIAKEYAFAVANSGLKATNIIIDKSKIKDTSYQILDSAFKFNIQRLENTLGHIDPSTKFLIITDEGRVGKMRKTSRRIQKINFIPSLHGAGTYRKEIKLLIEDPLPKKSQESYFIQIADFLAYFVYIYCINPKCRSNRLSWLSDENIKEIIEILKPAFNTLASRTNPYGFVIYPQ
ncbi:DUF3800 domain-containing protein [Candidatus Gracilibacteria bacterium]|nr:DUF3800 domain-containing protein [Candidatus Gracilibacteria bacterium]